MTTRELDAMLHREPDGTFSMYFCRGPGKCTTGTKKRTKLSAAGKVCRDCIKGDERDTLQDVADRIERGDG